MKRMFTRSEDELIIGQARGLVKLSINSMEIRLNTSRETLFRRAEELGVTLTMSVRSVRTENTDEVPYKITDDKLLKRLHQFHGNRMETKDGTSQTD